MSVEIIKDPEAVAKIKQELYHMLNELELTLSVTDHAKIAIGNFNEVELEELLKKFHDNLSEIKGKIKDEENKKRIRRLQALIANISMRLNQTIENQNLNISKPIDESNKIVVNTNIKDTQIPIQIINKLTPTFNNVRNFVNNVVDKIALSSNKEIITEQIKSQTYKTEADNLEVKDEIPVTQTEIKRETAGNSVVDEVLRNLIEAILKISKVNPKVNINSPHPVLGKHTNELNDLEKSQTFTSVNEGLRDASKNCISCL